MLWLSLAFADPATWIPVQGVLTDSSGAPVTGTRTVSFGLYADASATDLAWSGAVSVTLERGAFATWLLQTGTISDTHLAGPLWLTATVDGVQTAPALVGAVPRALYAARAGRVGTLAPADIVSWGALDASGQRDGDRIIVDWTDVQNIPSDVENPYSAGNGIDISGLGEISINAAEAATALASYFVAPSGGGNLAVSGTVSAGAVRIGSTAGACTSPAGDVGTLRFDGTSLTLCTNAGWTSITSTLGAAVTNPGASCQAIKTARPDAQSGAYWIDPNGAPASDAFQVYCQMTIDGGGWTALASFATGDSNNWTYYNSNWTSASTINATSFDVFTTAADRKYASYATLPFKQVMLADLTGTKYHVMYNFRDDPNLSFSSMATVQGSSDYYIWANRKASAGGGMWDYANWALKNIEPANDQCVNARVAVCKQTTYNHTGGGSLLGISCGGGTSQNFDLLVQSPYGTSPHGCDGTQPIVTNQVAADTYYVMFAR